MLNVLTQITKNFYYQNAQSSLPPSTLSIQLLGIRIRHLCSNLPFVADFMACASLRCVHGGSVYLVNIRFTVILLVPLTVKQEEGRES